MVDVQLYEHCLAGGCHPSAPMMSSQCLTLGWLCCIATEKIWWLLTKFIIK
ncbi:MAG: hypothetical protein ACRC6C_00440 [Wolbachia pipientis]